ncbi:galactosyltransferase-related protein [Mucilaginibacter auburnensis]|nr:galactosyltransferase-related protein [Mucilaginibacter auburnensis]
MNRLHQLKITLPQNITDNEDYEELEFIILDYNSEDGMEEWVQKNFSHYIDNGRLVYYKTNDPSSWSPSHSKNVAFKLATGDVLCSIWADYYTGKGFANYVNKTFQDFDNIVLTPIDFYNTKKNYKPAGDVLGKVCVKKSDFIKVEGFDERMDRHGFEDYDFINRLEMIGIERKLIEDFTYLNYISHGDEERHILPTDFNEMYIRYITPSESEVLLLYDDNHFEQGVLIDNYTINSDSYLNYAAIRNSLEYTLKDNVWIAGTWKRHDDKIIISSTMGAFEMDIKKNENSIYLTTSDFTDNFYHIISNDIIKGILTFKHFLYTQLIMEDNLKNTAVVVNKGKFGKATVYKNFSSDIIYVN